MDQAPPDVAIPRATLDTLAAALRSGGASIPIRLPDGGALAVRQLTDDFTSLQDYPDCWGTFGESPRGTRSRPDGFTGAAFKVTTRGGPLWWQPPADVAKDAGTLARVRERVRAYFLEHWYYVGVDVVRTSAPVRGPFGGEIAETVRASVFGIESDAGDYFADVVADLCHELNVTVATEAGGAD